jgi:hypothetical protein
MFITSFCFAHFPRAGFRRQSLQSKKSRDELCRYSILRLSIWSTKADASLVSRRQYCKICRPFAVRWYFQCSSCDHKDRTDPRCSTSSQLACRISPGKNPMPLFVWHILLAAQYLGPVARVANRNLSFMGLKISLGSSDGYWNYILTQWLERLRRWFCWSRHSSVAQMLQIHALRQCLRSQKCKASFSLAAPGITR